MRRWRMGPKGIRILLNMILKKWENGVNIYYLCVLIKATFDRWNFGRPVFRFTSDSLKLTHCYPTLSDVTLHCPKLHNVVRSYPVNFRSYPVNFRSYPVNSLLSESKLIRSYSTVRSYSTLSEIYPTKLTHRPKLSQLTVLWCQFQLGVNTVAITFDTDMFFY